MAGYTRQSASDIVDGANILAVHFNDEFDQLQAAFSSNAGHTHDGTAGNGGPITAIGTPGSNQLKATTIAFGPETTSNFIDLVNFQTIEAVESLKLNNGKFVAQVDKISFGSNYFIEAESNGHVFGSSSFGNSAVTLGGSSNSVQITDGNFSFNATTSAVSFACQTFSVVASASNTATMSNVQIGSTGTVKDGFFKNIDLEASGGSGGNLTLPTSGHIEFDNELRINRSASNKLRITDTSSQAEFIFECGNSDPHFESAGNIVLGNSQESNRFIEWGTSFNPGKFKYNDQQDYWEFYFDGSSSVAFAIAKDFSSNVKFVFGDPSSGAYLYYDTSNTKFKFNINNQDKWSVDSSGNLRITGFLFENQFSV